MGEGRGVKSGRGEGVKSGRGEGSEAWERGGGKEWERGEEKKKGEKHQNGKRVCYWYINSLCFHLHLLQQTICYSSVLSPVVPRYSAQVGWCMDYRTSPPQPNTLAHSRGQQETSPFFTSTQTRAIVVMKQEYMSQSPLEMGNIYHNKYK